MNLRPESQDRVFGHYALPRPAISTTGDGKVIRRDVLGGIVHEYERAG